MLKEDFDNPVYVSLEIFDNKLETKLDYEIIKTFEEYFEANPTIAKSLDLSFVVQQ